MPYNNIPNQPTNQVGYFILKSMKQSHSIYIHNYMFYKNLSSHCIHVKRTHFVAT